MVSRARVGTASRSLLAFSGAAAVLTLGVQGVAQAAEEPLPSFDFTGCPTSPIGDMTGLVCANAVATETTFAVGRAKATTKKQLAHTFGVFQNLETGESSSPFGGLRAEPIRLGGGLSVTPEYAGTFDFTYPDTALGLKFRVTGPKIGNRCYIGGDRKPIVFKLITGTTNPPPPNKPITGVAPRLVPGPPDTSVRLLTYVDNSFALPKATGCTYRGKPVNVAVNRAIGLPSRAGKNTVILKVAMANKPYSKLP